MGAISRQDAKATVADIPVAVTQEGQSQTEKVSLLKSAVHKFGGVVGTMGRILNAGTDVQVGVTQKILEKTGVLNKTDATTFGNVFKMSSNIDLLRRVGRERVSPNSLAGVFTGSYTPSTSVFSNFVKELPVTTIGLMGDIFL